MLTSRRRPLLILFDQNLKSAQGHYLGYAAAVAGAADRCGIQPIIVGHRDVDPSTGATLDVRPALARTYWQELAAPPGLDPYQHFADGALALADAVEQVCADAGADAGDVLFCPNANLVHAMAAARFADRLGDRLPRVALLFRRDCSEQGRLAGLGSRIGSALLRQALADLHAAPGASRVRLLTDSDELSDDYSEATGRRFQTAPIPVDPRLGARPASGDRRPTTLIYLGDARAEKGYDLLPAVAAALSGELREGRVRLIAQSNFNLPGGEPGIAAARAELARHPNVVLLEEPLSQDEYVAWLGESDLALLPYRPDDYVARTSGILAEALCAGLPAVVPGGTWLSGQVRRHGSGRVFVGHEAGVFVEAVLDSLKDLPGLSAAARERRLAYARFHNPARLVAFVCGADVLQRAART